MDVADYVGLPQTARRDSIRLVGSNMRATDKCGDKEGILGWVGN
jgi:hypothetical protein